jgi:nucleoside-diphosphate-sugar epimerase
MKICVTGSTGFIGKPLCTKLLKNNYSVLAATRYSNTLTFNFHKNLSIIKLDNFNSRINLQQALSGVDCVIHCAAKAHAINKNKSDVLKAYREVNVEVTRNFAEQAANAGVKRFVFLSSIKVNGERTFGCETFKYSDVPLPEDAYGVSKFEAEQMLSELSKQTGLEVVIIRAPLVYGEGVKGNFLYLLDFLYRGIPLPFASVANLRSFIGLDNLIDFIIFCIKHPKVGGHTFLVSDGQDISTPNLIRKLTGAIGKSSHLFPVPLSLIKLIGRLTGKSMEVGRLVNSLRVDSSYAREVLGWRPSFSLDEGLEKTVKWYLQNR